MDKFIESYNGKKEIKHSGRKKVDTSGSNRYNRSAYPDEFATNAMIWARSDKTIVGEQRFFHRGNGYVLVEKTEDDFIEVGKYAHRQRLKLLTEVIERNEEIHNRRRDGTIRNRVDGYRAVKDEYSRYFADGLGESQGDGSGGGLHRSKS